MVPYLYYLYIINSNGKLYRPKISYHFVWIVSVEKRKVLDIFMDLGDSSSHDKPSS